jgi:uncharacterized SAM-binding protein YcdF (DUF218 family)
VLDPITVKAVLKALVLPPTGPLLLAALGLLLARRHPRTGRGLAAIGIVVLFALSIPAVAALLLRVVDASPPLDLGEARSAQAIVILGGGTRRNAAEYDGDTLGRLTLERVRYGARVARLTGLPVLVTGGTVSEGETEAKLMREALEHEFGVDVQWSEDRSRTTHENAAFSAPLLREAGVRRVVLVAHSFDIPRARAEFAAQGVETIAAPTGIVALHFTSPFDYLPSVAGLQSSYYALYEMLANAMRWATAAE